ncbi:HNH endonuclease [Pantoea sp. RIT-PI-b]|uniref:HNH endonuclease n=1 Tax=Pantoea sp. RIT-PI-b TaxID=1681195 RepID=UPI00067670D8|nr:HNH endonuclease [Pantoea sp. RIT-PI-b]
MNILWKQTQYKNFEVSNTGLVRNTKTKKTFNPSPGTNGYKKVTLSLGNGVNITKEVHRLVAETFKPNSTRGLVVDHIDGDKLNNHIDNLQWISQKQNLKKAKRKGTNQPRLTQSQIDEIVKMRNAGKSFIQITKELNTKYSRSSHRQTYTKAYYKATK